VFDHLLVHEPALLTLLGKANQHHPAQHHSHDTKHECKTHVKRPCIWYSGYSDPHPFSRLFRHGHTNPHPNSNPNPTNHNHNWLTMDVCDLTFIQSLSRYVVCSSRSMYSVCPVFCHCISSTFVVNKQHITVKWQKLTSIRRRAQQVNTSILLWCQQCTNPQQPAMIGCKLPLLVTRQQYSTALPTLYTVWS